METLVMLVFLACGGLFAYREWLLIQQHTGRMSMTTVPPSTGAGTAPPTIGFSDNPVIDVTTYPASPVTQPRFKMPKWLIVIGAMLDLISPIDAVPDFIPLAGQADDLAVIVMAIRSLFRK